MKDNQLKTTGVAFTTLFISFCIALYLSLETTSDHGWWPLALVVFTIVTTLYSWIYTNINKVYPRSALFTFIYNYIVGLFIIVHGYLYAVLYTDWYSINEGSSTLNITEKIVYNDFSLYVILVIALVIFYILQRLESKRTI